jgi:hypothetical protein
MSYRNFEVSEATKRVYKAEIIERLYDNLMAATDSCKTDIQYYEERLTEKKNADTDFMPENDGAYRDIIINRTKAEVYKVCAKELLKL